MTLFKIEFSYYFVNPVMYKINLEQEVFYFVPDILSPIVIFTLIYVDSDYSLLHRI